MMRAGGLGCANDTDCGCAAVFVQAAVGWWWGCVTPVGARTAVVWCAGAAKVHCRESEARGPGTGEGGGPLQASDKYNEGGVRAGAAGRRAHARPPQQQQQQQEGSTSGASGIGGAHSAHPRPSRLCCCPLRVAAVPSRCVCVSVHQWCLHAHPPAFASPRTAAHACNEQQRMHHGGERMHHTLAAGCPCAHTQAPRRPQPLHTRSSSSSTTTSTSTSSCMVAPAPCHHPMQAAAGGGSSSTGGAAGRPSRAWPQGMSRRWRGRSGSTLG